MWGRLRLRSTAKGVSLLRVRVGRGGNRVADRLASPARSRRCPRQADAGRRRTQTRWLSPVRMRVGRGGSRVADRLAAPAHSRRCPRRADTGRRRTQTRSLALAQTCVRLVGKRMRFPSRPTPAHLGWPDSPPPGSRPGLSHPCDFAVGKEGGSGVRGAGRLRCRLSVNSGRLRSRVV